ncbi:hypothetical protein ACN47E_007375 [Coniothyrium glycines]
MRTLPEQLEIVRTSWLCNYTQGNDAWRSTQLHRLQALLFNHVDDLLDCLVGIANPLPYEREIALLLSDIQQHLAYVDYNEKGQWLSSDHLGSLNILHQATGVSLIILGQKNFLRTACAALAASIAAGNPTVLATRAGSDDRLVSLMLSLLPRYMDSDCIALVPDFDAADLNFANADLVTIYDDSSDLYSSLSASRKIRICETSQAVNIALITNGPKSWDILAEEIYHMASGDVLPTDRLNIVFVPTEDAQTLEQTLLNIGSEGSKRNLCRVESLDRLNDDHLESSPKFHVQSMGQPSELYIISVGSIERAIDIMNNLSTPIQQLAVLGPQAERVARFIQRWVSVRTISTECIYPLALPAGPELSYQQPGKGTLISSWFFSRPLSKARSKPDLFLLESVKQLRARGRNSMVKFMEEPLGERMSFFDQVDYVLKGLGATFGLVTILGIVYSVRHVKNQMR